MAIGVAPGCTGPWHRIPHVCPARHFLRRSLLWPAATSVGCSARRGWAGSSLRDNDGMASQHTGGHFSSSTQRIQVIFGAFGRGLRPYARRDRCCASVCCICGVNRPRERERSHVRHCDECGPYLSESFRSLLEIRLCVSQGAPDRSGAIRLFSNQFRRVTKRE